MEERLWVQTEEFPGFPPVTWQWEERERERERRRRRD
jgi:hypothetical protein